jgi:hypothetical protein
MEDTIARSEEALDIVNPSSVELTILMPCLNEAETLAVCITKAQDYLARSGVAGEVLVADNGSTDGSQDIARQLGARVTSVPRPGYGAALLGGIEAARGRYIIMGDADDSYDLAKLDAFVERLRGGADLVMGNRFQGGISSGAMPPLHYYLGNPVLSFLGRLMFKIPVGDFHCGLRGFRADAIRSLGLTTTGMEFASEMVVRSALSNLVIEEVPTTLKPDGRSRAPHLKTWRDGWRHLKFLLMFSPKWLFFVPGIILATVGTILAGALAFGAVRPLDSGVQLSLNTFAAACFMVICGVQLLSFGTVARNYASIVGLLPEGPRAGMIRRLFKTDNVVRVAALVFVIGAALVLFALDSWASVGFGDLDNPLVSRAVIGGLSLIVIAVQAASQAFMAGILEIPMRTGYRR